VHRADQCDVHTQSVQLVPRGWNRNSKTSLFISWDFGMRYCKVGEWRLLQ